MIYTVRTVKINNGTATIDEPVILYRGDRKVEIQFEILNPKLKFSKQGNMIESTQAHYGQLAIINPNGSNAFTEIAETKDGAVVFEITGEMIDQLEEVGFYSFHIRLYDETQESRISLPPVNKGIEIREPIAIEDDMAQVADTVGDATVGYALVREGEEPVGDTFDTEGKYNKTVWADGDKITEGKLNKIEDALDVINEKEVDIDLSSYATIAEVDRKILEAQLPEGEVDFSALVIDQAYNAESTNAQSGVAVAEAIAPFSNVTVMPNFDAWSKNLVDRATITSGMYSTNASAVNGVLENASYSHTELIDVSSYSKIAFRYKDSEFSWTKYNWGYWVVEPGVITSANKIEVQGAWDADGGPEIILDVPAGVKYVGFNFYSKPSAVDSRFYVKGFIGGEGETFINANKIYPAVNSTVKDTLPNVEQYKGLKWVSFGDSITAQGTWQPIVADFFELEHVNCGIGSTCLGGATEETDLPRFWQDVRLDAVKAEDPDVVTILGGANDLFSYIQVGTTDEFDKALEEKDKGTFLGAYSYIIENLLTWKPSLKIVILTTTFAHNNVDKSGQCYTDFADASREIANYYGLLCADLFRKTGFNKLTQSTYTKDGIHPNDLGGERIAHVVIGAMLEG